MLATLMESLKVKQSRKAESTAEAYKRLVRDTASNAPTDPDIALEVLEAARKSPEQFEADCESFDRLLKLEQDIANDPFDVVAYRAHMQEVYRVASEAEAAAKVAVEASQKATQASVAEQIAATARMKRYESAMKEAAKLRSIWS